MSRKRRTDEHTNFVATGRDIDDINLILRFEKSKCHWEVIGTADDQYRIEAQREYETNPVIKTIKALVEKNPQGWRGNCTELKVQIYEQSGELYNKSVETVGRIVNGYKDRLHADGIIHREERRKKHYFVKKNAGLLALTQSEVGA